MDSEAPHAESITVSRRDRGELQERLGSWLDGVAPGARVTGLTATAGTNGMSSETVLFDADLPGEGPARLVARIAPDTSDVPVFPSYDLATQFHAMTLVAERSSVPVPRCRWLETDSSAIGSEFFVMDRIDGRVPPDNLPYTFEGWVLDADPADRRRLQDASVRILAGIHGIDLAGVDTTPYTYPEAGDSALRTHVGHWRTYYDWVRGDRPRMPVVDDAFAWLDAHWPADGGGDTVLSWGDARIGNMMFDGFDPVAVLDWEMVGLGPRGIDVGWMSYLHSFFQHITEAIGLPGIPDMMVLDDVAATYAEASGVEVVDPYWYAVYAATRHAVIMARVTHRSVHFGEAEASDDPEAGIIHKDQLREMIS